MQRESKPIAWRPSGVTDVSRRLYVCAGRDAAIAEPDPRFVHAHVWVCRPASLQLIDFNALGGTFDSISVFKISGSVVYGTMRQTVGGMSGFDVPFAYNLLTNLQITVTGPTTTTSPASQPITAA